MEEIRAEWYKGSSRSSFTDVSSKEDRQSLANSPFDGVSRIHHLEDETDFTSDTDAIISDAKLRRSSRSFTSISSMSPIPTRKQIPIEQMRVAKYVQSITSNPRSLTKSSLKSSLPAHSVQFSEMSAGASASNTNFRDYHKIVTKEPMSLADLAQHQGSRHSLHRQHSIHSVHSAHHLHASRAATGSEGSSVKLQKGIPGYKVLAWVAFACCFPLGIVALKKAYQVKPLEERGEDDKAKAASDITRFASGIAILFGILICTTALAWNLKRMYADGV